MDEALRNAIVEYAYRHGENVPAYCDPNECPSCGSPMVVGFRPNWHCLWCHQRFRSNPDGTVEFRGTVPRQFRILKD